MLGWVRVLLFSNALIQFCRSIIAASSIEWNARLRKFEVSVNGTSYYQDAFNSVTRALLSVGSLVVITALTSLLVKVSLDHVAVTCEQRLQQSYLYC